MSIFSLFKKRAPVRSRTSPEVNVDAAEVLSKSEGVAAPVVLISDKPISSESEDKLGYGHFASALARSLSGMIPPEGLVISVEGAWGLGKTSVLQLALNELKAEEIARISKRTKEQVIALSDSQIAKEWDDLSNYRMIHLISFNPWVFVGQENLVRAFFTEVSAAIGFKNNGKIGRLVDGLRDKLPVIGTFVGAGTAAYATAGIAAPVGATLGRAAGDAMATRQSQSLERAKKELADALKEVGEKIIVVIDDIDRLNPSEMRLIFSMVKSLGDLPNIAYLLSFDRTVVETAISKGESGIDISFLEKIIQVTLDLPPADSSRLSDIFITRVNSIITDREPVNQDRWIGMLYRVIMPYIHTPRDVARLSNLLQVTWPALHDRVDLTDFIALNAIRAFDKQLYLFITHNIVFLVGADQSFKKTADFINEIPFSDFVDEEVSKIALSYMFPRLREKLGTYISDSATPAEIGAHRRIGSPDYYKSYFSLGPDPDYLTVRQLRDLMSQTESLREVLVQSKEVRAASGLSRVAHLIEQLTEEVASSPRLTFELSQVLLEESRWIVLLEDRERTFMSSTNLDRIMLLLRAGMLRLSERDRSSLFMAIICCEPGLSIRARLVNAELVTHGLNGRTREHREPLVSPDLATQAASIIVDQIRGSASANKLIMQSADVNLLFFWYKETKNNELRDWVDSFIEDDDKLLDFCSHLVHLDERMPDGTRMVTIRLERPYIKKMFDIDRMISRLEDLRSQTSLSPRVNLLLDELESSFAN